MQTEIFLTIIPGHRNGNLGDKKFAIFAVSGFMLFHFS